MKNINSRICYEFIDFYHEFPESENKEYKLKDLEFDGIFDQKNKMTIFKNDLNLENKLRNLKEENLKVNDLKFESQDYLEDDSFKSMDSFSTKLYTGKFEYKFPINTEIYIDLFKLKSVKHLLDKNRIAMRIILPIYDSKHLKSLYSKIHENVTKLDELYKLNNNLEILNLINLDFDKEKKNYLKNIDEELNKYISYN